MTPEDFTPLWSAQRGADSPLKLLGVRGALQPSGKPNSDAVYDDLIFVIDETANRVTAWLASVDPSLPLIQHPINPAGCAQLAPGVHFFARGIHKGNSAWPCLVQAEAFTVYRLAKDGSINGKETGDFGIHLHSGGAGSSTKNFSAGCQIIHNVDGYFRNPTWGNFIQPIFTAMKAAGVASIPYLLLNASTFNLSLPTKLENPVVP
ncbi:MAG: hypothetical protein ACFUZC_03385 [Chthoniobacteraceae bacterium]